MKQLLLKLYMWCEPLVSLCTWHKQNLAKIIEKGRLYTSYLVLSTYPPRTMLREVSRVSSLILNAKPWLAKKVWRHGNRFASRVRRGYFRRERSDDRKCVCCSQARPEPMFLALVMVLNRVFWQEFFNRFLWFMESLIKNGRTLRKCCLFSSRYKNVWDIGTCLKPRFKKKLNGNNLKP